jgi:flagellin-like hook-associated protein FlgL
VINTINTQLAAGGIANVTVSVALDKNSLVITDSNIAPLNVEISEGTPGGRTAGDLGLIGTVISELVGRDLLPMHIQVLEDAPGQNTASELGLLGGTEFAMFEGKDIDPEFTYYTLLSTLNSGAGYQFGKIRIVNGHDYKEIDLGPLNNDPNATVMDMINSINSSGLHVEARVNEQRTGIEVFSTVNGRSLMITEADTGRTAKDLGIFGSPDLLGNLLVLQGALERNNTEEINLCLETFTGAQDRILIETSNVGARSNRAQSAESRGMMYDIQMIRQLAEIEDADMTKVITDLTSAEFVYQSALASAAKILQPSLLQFLQ